MPLLPCTASLRLPLHFGYRSTSATASLRLTIHLGHRSTSATTLPQLSLDVCYCSNSTTSDLLLPLRPSATSATAFLTSCYRFATPTAPLRLPLLFCYTLLQLPPDVCYRRTSATAEVAEVLTSATAEVLFSLFDYGAATTTSPWQPQHFGYRSTFATTLLHIG